MVEDFKNMLYVVCNGKNGAIAYSKGLLSAFNNDEDKIHEFVVTCFKVNYEAGRVNNPDIIPIDQYIEENSALVDFITWVVTDTIKELADETDE